MKFTDLQLQKSYDGNFAEANGVSDDLRKVYALIGVHDLFKMLEGPQSARVRETIEHLLLPGLRPMLHRWYHRAGSNSGPMDVELRDRLSQLAGERFGIEPEFNPS